MIITKIEQLQPLFDFIDKHENLELDYESTGVQVRKDQVIGFAITTDTEGFYVVHQMWDGNKLVIVIPKEVCISILQRLKGKKLGFWNASFDVRLGYYYFGVNLLDELHADGMLALHTIMEEGVPFSHRPFALKTAAAHFLGEDATNEQAEMKTSIKANGGGPTEFYKADYEKMGLYAIQDGKLTAILKKRFLKQIEEEGLGELFFIDEVMPLYREVLIPMEMCGLPVHVEGLEDGLKSVEAARQTLESQIQAAIKPLLAEFEEWFLNKDYPPKRTGPFAQAAVDFFAPDSMPRTDSGAYSLTTKNIANLSQYAINTGSSREASGQMAAGYLQDWLSEEFLLRPEEVIQIQRRMHGTTPMFNLLSKFHLKRLFFDKLQEKPLSKTETGLPQCDEQFLDSVAHKYEWVPWLIEYNKLTKIKSAYVERLLEEHEDGTWYPSFSLHRTISGRLGSDAQQFPRPLEEGQASELVREHNNKIRHYFKAKPGYCFTGADQESLEPKCFAHASTDEKLREIFRKGHCFYSTVAIDVEGYTQYSADKSAPNFLGKLNKAARQDAKPYSLGFPYGYSAYKLHMETGRPKEECDRKYRNYFTAYNHLYNWMQETHAECYTKGYVFVETGRKRRFPQAVKIYQKYGEAILDDLKLWKQYHTEPGVYTEAKKARRVFKNLINNSVNVKIQGLAASIINRACIKIARKLKAESMMTKICLQVHDEVCLYGPISESKRAAEIMQEIMENNYTISVPLKAEAQSSETYGGTK